ncbi:hypothetical protein [Clostridium algidicarnis]|uniref:CorA-like Mg2+ transporter protein n=1 Tax=Clostridium algidicarnis TaxID=37659 RepID=A0ABS6C2C7_9CLOT|nr:hypothetical protein [Clostridium algidicarnis]MBU3219620.1 hypothetical protein [Clostridium algidicarnis]
MGTDDKIISSHIFIFPFRWDVVKGNDSLNTCIDDRLKVDAFIELLRNKWEVDSNIASITKFKEVKNSEDYNTFAYFYSNVSEAIYGKDSSIKSTRHFFAKPDYKQAPNRIVSCLNYNNINENSTYEIFVEKHASNGCILFNKTYKLKIKSIKLKIYDTGIATLSYFLKNEEYEESKDILIINDYGRRIYPQYLPLEEVQNSFLAKSISLRLQNETIEEDFIYDSKKYPCKVSKTITELLGLNFKSTEKEIKEFCFNKEKNIFIKPIIDDRMFVICYYNSDVWSSILTNFKQDKHLTSDFWYQYLFIDNELPTCQDENLKKELLAKSTYTRWKNEGTLFGISRYSFVLLCDESCFSKNVLYNHINTIYYEMIVLSLVQRASILRFSDETSRISSFENKDIYKQIKKLQEYYIRFINTIYFREVTAQEQGIELYDKLTELMRIEKEVKRLDEEIDEIQRYINLKTNEKTNETLNLITYIGLSVSIMTFVATIYSPYLILKDCKTLIVIFGLGMVTILVIWINNLIKSGR